MCQRRADNFPSIEENLSKIPLTTSSRLKTWPIQTNVQSSMKPPSIWHHSNTQPLRKLQMNWNLKRQKTSAPSNLKSHRCLPAVGSNQQSQCIRTQNWQSFTMRGRRGRERRGIELKRLRNEAIQRRTEAMKEVLAEGALPGGYSKPQLILNQYIVSQYMLQNKTSITLSLHNSRL